MVAPWTFLSGMIIYRIFCPREHVKSFILTLNTFIDINSFKKGITCWWSVAETGADKGIHLTHVFAIWLWNIIGYVFGKYPVTNGIDGLGVLPKLTEVKLELMIVWYEHRLHNIFSKILTWPLTGVWSDGHWWMTSRYDALQQWLGMPRIGHDVVLVRYCDGTGG